MASWVMVSKCKTAVCCLQAILDSDDELHMSSYSSPAKQEE